METIDLDLEVVFKAAELDFISGQLLEIEVKAKEAGKIFQIVESLKLKYKKALEEKKTAPKEL